MSLRDEVADDLRDVNAVQTGVGRYTEQPVPVELMQRIWANLYYDEPQAGGTFQATLNDVVDWLAKHSALPPTE